MKFEGIEPERDAKSFVAEGARIIGKVRMKEYSSLWFISVARGDVNYIRIGCNSNIQDLSMLHVSSPSAEKPNGSPLIIGDEVTVGHRVTLHGCTIGNRVLVGMGSIVLDDAVIEDEVMIGAGSLVPPRKRLASGYLYVGSPVKPVRELSAEERAFLKHSAMHYVGVAADYMP